VTSTPDATECIHRDEFSRWFDARRCAIVGSLLDYISIDTATPNEAAAGEFLRDYLAGVGAELDYLPLAEGLSAHRSFSPHQASDTSPSRGNWRAVLGYGESPTWTLFNAHVDVVPATPDFNEAFRPRQDGDLIIGRGACDTKNNLIMLVEAIRFLRDREIPLQRSVVLDLPIEEEIGGNGTLALALAVPDVHEAVCLEPTSLQVMRGHRGCLTFRVDVRGRSVHMGSTATGMDAISGAIDVITQLRVLEREMLTAARDEPGFENVSTPLQLNVGVIAGGEWSGSVPERCSLTADIGFMPSTTLEELERRIDRICRTIPQAWMAERLEVHFDVGLRNDAYLIRKSERIVTDLTSAANRHDASRGEIGAWQVSCDARIYNKVCGLPTVVFGSGALAHAHSPHEQVSLREMRTGIAILADFLASSSTGSPALER
jgi:acetylornithine deacetylase